MKRLWLLLGVLTILTLRMTVVRWIPPGMFNDEGVELLQARDMPWDHFRFFAPSYIGGIRSGAFRRSGPEGRPTEA